MGGKAEIREAFQRCGVGFRELLALDYLPHDGPEHALGDHPGIEHAQAARRGVARVREDRLPLSGALFVDALEIVSVDDDLGAKGEGPL